MMDLKIFIARYLKVATGYNRKGVENCIICDLAFFFSSKLSDFVTFFYD